MSDTPRREDRIAAGCMQVLGFAFFGLIMLISVWPDGNDGGSGSASSDVTWGTYDVTIDVREDGSLHVTEYQEVEFNGQFSTGFVEIPMERIESIDNVTVTLEEGVAGDGVTPIYLMDEEPEGGLVQAEHIAWNRYDEDANTFRARQEGGLYLIDYAFDRTPSSRFSSDTVNSTRTIIVEYDAHGVIRDYPDVEEPWQQLHWLAISSDVTSIAPVESASVTITLPQDIPEGDLVVAPEPDSRDGSTITWTRASMDEGDSFDVQAAFPTITWAASPSWQDAADARDASLEEREARANAGRLMMILAGIAILVAGGLILLYAWYRRVREPHVGPVHDTLAEPPGDMPAILVGSLLDEAVDPRDIAAGVLDLDRQGVITIREGDETEPEGYYLTLNERVPEHPAWAHVLLRSVFGHTREVGETKGFSALRTLFNADRDAMQRAINLTLVDEGYYEEDPEVSRKHWRWVTNGFLIAGIVVAVAILAWSRSWTWLALAPVVLGFALHWFAKKLTPHVAVKTLKGAEVAAQWRAFQRHLDQTMIWRSPAGREEDKIAYAPWMVAFGIERGWLSAMNRASWDTSRPKAGATSSRSIWLWEEPGTSSETSTSGGSRLAGRRAGSGGTTVRPPAWSPTSRSWDPGSWGDMQAMSNRASSGLSSASSSMFSMIGDMLESLGESSGGSGGGSSGGGSSSWGSSSRSGGGGSSSSSGGGRRGFG